MEIVNKTHDVLREYDTGFRATLFRSFPGVMLIYLGINIVYCSLYRYYLCEREAKSGKTYPRRYESSFLYHVNIYGRVHIVNYAAILGSFSGFMVVVFLGISKGYVLFLGYLLTASVDLMGKLHYPIPKHSEYYAGLLTVWSNTMILWSHAHGDSLLNVQIYNRILLLMVILCFVIILEVFHTSKVKVAVIRGYILIYLGCWYITVVIYLLHPHYVNLGNENVDDIGLDITFGVEMICLAIVVILIGIVAYRRVKILASFQVSEIVDAEFSMINNVSKYSLKTNHFDDGSTESLVHPEFNC